MYLVQKLPLSSGKYSTLHGCTPLYVKNISLISQGLGKRSTTALAQIQQHRHTSSSRSLTASHYSHNQQLAISNINKLSSYHYQHSHNNVCSQYDYQHNTFVAKTSRNVRGTVKTLPHQLHYGASNLLQCQTNVTGLAMQHNRKYSSLAEYIKKVRC